MTERATSSNARAADAADGARSTRTTCFHGPGRRRSACSTCSRAGRQLIVQPLHVRARLGRRAARAAPPAPTRSPTGCCATCTPARPVVRGGRPGAVSRSSPRTRAERGWTFPLYSSYGSDFNYDFHVTLDESVAPVEYNYRTKAEHEAAGTTGYVAGEQPIEQPGESYFLRDGDARVPHLLDVRPRHRGDRRLVRLPRPDGPRPPGGVGGAEGPGSRPAPRGPGLRELACPERRTASATLALDAGRGPRGGRAG